VRNLLARNAALPVDIDRVRVDEEARLVFAEHASADDHPSFQRDEDSAVLLSNDPRRLNDGFQQCVPVEASTDIGEVWSKDYWRQIEDYLHHETGVDFSHGIWPPCMEKIKVSDLP
jgi:hypothetical protein